MPIVTHRSGPHVYVLGYESADDLTSLCESILALTEEPTLDFGISDAAAIAAAIAEQMALHALAKAQANAGVTPATEPRDGGQARA